MMIPVNFNVLRTALFLALVTAPLTQAQARSRVPEDDSPAAPDHAGGDGQGSNGPTMGGEASPEQVERGISLDAVQNAQQICLAKGRPGLDSTIEQISKSYFGSKKKIRGSNASSSQLLVASTTTRNEWASRDGLAMVTDGAAGLSFFYDGDQQGAASVFPAVAGNTQGLTPEQVAQRVEQAWASAPGTFKDVAIHSQARSGTPLTDGRYQYVIETRRPQGQGSLAELSVQVSAAGSADAMLEYVSAPNFPLLVAEKLIRQDGPWYKHGKLNGHGPSGEHIYGDFEPRNMALKGLKVKKPASGSDFLRLFPRPSEIKWIEETLKDPASSPESRQRAQALQTMYQAHPYLEVNIRDYEQCLNREIQQERRR
jgi:hypothetical protein